MNPNNDQQIRKATFLRNNNLESFLKEINKDLFFCEKELLDKNIQEYPLIFIVGSLRSGSTLTLQWLASLKQFAYPTNLLSRFYGAPIIGSKIQLLLTDERYNYRNEIKDFTTGIKYISENGKTTGALSPNEFWYFWRRFLKFGELDYKSNKELFREVDIDTLRKELFGISNVFEKPFALKAMICNYNIEFLNKVFDKALFIYTRRDPYTNIESALNARERQSGSVNNWYSFKIPEYEELMKIKDPIKQVAGQIYYINKAVQEGLANVEENKKLIVDYELFCNNPKYYYEEIVCKLNNQGYKIENNYKGPENFKITRDKAVSEEFIEAYSEFQRG